MSSRDPCAGIDADAQATSERLTERIKTAIAEAGGAIPFDRFMDMALYEPGLGYYRAGAARFGAGGDFATAPELTSLFGRALARQAAEILQHLGGGDILELGPGTGRLTADALRELERLGHLPERWRCLEVSAALRQEQERTLSAHVPHLLERLEWVEALPSDSRPTLWLANEVLDALPVKRFIKQACGLRELGVTTGAEGLAWTELEPAPELSEAVEQIERFLEAPLPEGYVSEACTLLPSFLRGLAASLDKGVALWIDYGYPRREYYLAERHGGTLLCHFQHRAHDNPFFYPGLQDITAFVDFTAVAEAARAAGLEVLGYAPQGPFLVGGGLAACAEADMARASASKRVAIANEVQRLTHPGDMGERFKVMALGQGYEGPLSGFRMTDRRERL